MAVFVSLSRRATVYTDPYGEEIFVYRSDQTADAGKAVASALQELVGDAITIYAEPKYSTRSYSDEYGFHSETDQDYWLIKYKDKKDVSKLSTALKTLVEDIVEAIDDSSDIMIYLSDTMRGGKVKLSTTGYAATYCDPGIAGSATVYIDYKYLTENKHRIDSYDRWMNATLPPEKRKDKINPLVDDPYSVVLAHEVLGHALRYIDDRGDHLHKGDGLYDNIYKYENEVIREAYNEVHKGDKDFKPLEYRAP